MAKNTTKIIAGVLLAGGVFFLIKYLMPKKEDKKKDKEPLGSPPKKDETLPKPTSSSFPLKKGSKGSLVKKVQTLLMQLDSKNLPKFGADGSFGSETELALQKELGKKTIDSQADIDTLQNKYNSRIKLFAPKGGVNPPMGLPELFPGYGTGVPK